MRKVMLALASFIAGAASMSLLGNHTSTLAQAPNKSPGPIGLPSSVPTVPPFGNFKASNVDVKGLRFPVDGVFCTDCTFESATLVYGGGEFAFVRPTFSGATQIKLDGAAMNTATFLAAFGLLGCQAETAPQKQMIPDPIIKAKYTPAGDLQIRSDK